MTKGLNGRAARALAVLGVTALAGCGAPGEGGFGVGDMLLTAGTTQPPAQSAGSKPGRSWVPADRPAAMTSRSRSW
jgi:hypothetical protein